MTGLNGAVDNFQNEVGKLVRPYIPISEAEYQKLVDGQHDYYLLKDGRVATFGTADQGYALMPLTEEAAAIIRKINTIPASQPDIELPNKYTNHYKCDTCDIEWEDTWSCACDDECPECETALSPVRSEPLPDWPLQMLGLLEQSPDYIGNRNLQTSSGWVVEVEMHTWAKWGENPYDLDSWQSPAGSRGGYLIPIVE